MKLNDLKSTWQVIKVRHAMDQVQKDEVLKIIESGEVKVVHTFQRVFNNAVMSLVLTICCQGG